MNFHILRYYHKYIYIHYLEYIFEHSGEGESNIKYLNNLQDSNNLAFFISLLYSAYAFWTSDFRNNRVIFYYLVDIKCLKDK